MSRHTSLRSAGITLGIILTGMSGAALAAPLPPLPTLTTGGASLALRLDANAINGDGNPNPINGAAISTWTDLNGGTNDATNSGAARPTYSAAGLGGHPTVQFNGSAQYLNEALALRGPTTIFLVYQQNGALPSGGFQSLMTLANVGAGTDDEVLLFDSASGYKNISAEMDYSSSGSVGFNTTLDTSPHQLAIDYAGPAPSTPGDYQMSYGQTGETVVASSIFSQIPVTGRIGSRAGASPNNLFNGDISEVLIYTGSLNSTDFNAVQSYLNTEFFTTAPEPSSMALLLVGGVVTLRRRRRLA